MFLKNNTPCISKQPLMMAYEGFKSAWDNFGKFIYQFQPETKTLIRKLERIPNKLYRQNLSLLFNETCLNERLLPNYTHTLSLFKFIHFMEFNDSNGGYFSHNDYLRY